MWERFVLESGQSASALDIGFRAFSARFDNFSNQWLQEQYSLTWIPPYTIGMVVQIDPGIFQAYIKNQAPVIVGQPTAIAGEYTVALYYDTVRQPSPGLSVAPIGSTFYGQTYHRPVGLPLSFELLEYGAGGVGPHGQTQRATFTLPAGDIAFVEMLKVQTWRDGAPGTPGQAAAWATFTAASGGGAQIVALAQTSPGVSGLDLTQTDEADLGYLNPGDTITFNTIDQSTGGTNSFYMTAKIMLFGLPS